MTPEILNALLGTTAGAHFVSAATETKLSPSDEAKFQAWKTSMAPHDSGFDYDYRGAFQAGVGPAENKHWPDTFKKPTHPTYSNESRYSVPGAAGSWSGEQFTPALLQQLLGPIMRGEVAPVEQLGP